MKKVFGVKVDEFAEAAIFSLAWTAGLTSAYVAYYGREQVFLAAAMFLFVSSVGMYYFLKLEAHQKAKREKKKQSGEEVDTEASSPPESPTGNDQPSQESSDSQATKEEPLT